MEAVTDVKNLKLALLVITIALWLCWLWQRRNLYWFALKFPGEWGVPIIGAFYKALYQSANLSSKSHEEYNTERFTYKMGFYNCFFFFSDILPTLKKQFESFNTSCIWFGPHLAILTQEPEFIEKVLSSPDLLNKAQKFYDPFFKIFGGGITASPGEF